MSTHSKTQQIYIHVKSVTDFLFSVLMLIPLTVLSVIIKLAYLIMKETGPLFYTQSRIGKDGKEFQIIKFRTMSLNAEEKLSELLKDENNRREWEKHHKLKNDPRITTLGWFLRKSSLDEFPQFINVLKGDMSVIGPRPLVSGELKMHGGLSIYESVKPGITGWWACNGRSVSTYRERLEYEYYYIENVSLLLDLKIIFRTIVCIINQEGAQ